MIEIPNSLVSIGWIVQIRLRVGDLSSATYTPNDWRTSSNMDPNNIDNLVSFFTSSSNFLIAGWMDLGCLSTCSIVSLRNLWWCRLSWDNQSPVYHQLYPHQRANNGYSWDMMFIRNSCVPCVWHCDWKNWSEWMNHQSIYMSLNPWGQLEIDIDVINSSFFGLSILF